MAIKAVSRAEQYTYRITWSNEDKEFVGLCAEFPSLSWLDKTPVASLQGISKLVKEVIADMQSNKENIPLPFSLRKFSGRFMVRVPPDVHRNLTIQAAESKISINRLVSAKLSE
jgi:predicted HicB family RNase H-like nuclease